MAWQDVPESAYKVTATFPYQKDFSCKPVLLLQYDDASITPTKVKLRFKLSKSTSGSLWDMFYVLLNPTDTNKRSLHPLKTEHTENSSAHWPYIAATTFEVSKSYSDGSFEIPELWICNDGNNATSDRTALGFYNHYNDSEWRGQVLRYTKTATDVVVAATSTVAGAVGKPDVWITDNGDNTFTVGGTDGAAGTNNPATTAYSWGYGNYNTSGKVTNQAISIKASEALVSVTAKAVTTGTYGSTAEDTAVANIKNYQAPGQPGKPVISYSKTRLTIKENWQYSWAAARATNSSSSIVGYRLRVYKNGTAITGLTYRSAQLSKGTSSATCVDTETATNLKVTFNPISFGFVPGDKVKFSVQAYTKNADDTVLVGTVNTSDELTVLNAGVMRVRSGDSLVEGIVKVWSDGAWQEADIVKYHDGIDWKESE